MYYTYMAFFISSLVYLTFATKSLQLPMQQPMQLPVRERRYVGFPAPMTQQAMSMSPMSVTPMGGTPGEYPPGGSYLSRGMTPTQRQVTPYMGMTQTQGQVTQGQPSTMMQLMQQMMDMIQEQRRLTHQLQNLEQRQQLLMQQVMDAQQRQQ